MPAVSPFSSLNTLLFASTFTLLLFFTGAFFPLLLSFVLAAAIAYFSRQYLPFINQRLPIPSNAYVFITGCSTGIGFDSALALAAAGFGVFATVRSTKDADKLTQAAKNHNKGDLTNRLEVVLMDVNNASDIEKAVARVRARVSQGGNRLLGLIHNAGFTESGPLELLPTAKLEKQFTTNVYAPILITQAFLPLLREGASRAHTSRIILVSSGVGWVTYPGSGVYSATKHAIEAIGDALRMELKQWPIDVSIVEPGAIATNFASTANATRGANETEGIVEAEKRGVTKDVIAHYQRCNEKNLHRANNMQFGAASLVTESFFDALLDSKPLPRLLVGKDVSVLPVLLCLPDAIWDKILGKTYAPTK